MCGRYELNVTPERLKGRFDLSGDLFLPVDIPHDALVVENDTRWAAGGAADADGTEGFADAQAAFPSARGVSGKET